MCSESHRNPQAIRPTTIYVLCERNRRKDSVGSEYGRSKKLWDSSEMSCPAKLTSLVRFQYCSLYMYKLTIIVCNKAIVEFLYKRYMYLYMVWNVARFVTKLTEHFINTKDKHRWVSVLLDTEHDTIANICPHVTAIRYTVWGRLNRSLWTVLNDSPPYTPTSEESV